MGGGGARRGEAEICGSLWKKGPEGLALGDGGVETSLSVLLVFVSFSAVIWVTVGVVVEVHFVHGFDSLGQIVLKGCDGRAQCWGPETVRDEAEMGQTALDSRFENRLRPWVPQWRAILGQQVCELFADLPITERRAN